MHSTTVSKKLLGLGPVVAVRFGQRQIAVFLVDGACSFRRAYDLDRGNQAQLPTVRYRKRPDAPAHAGSLCIGLTLQLR